MSEQKKTPKKEKSYCDGELHSPFLGFECIGEEAATPASATVPSTHLASSSGKTVKLHDF